ncbi:hypothetical protein [Marinicellulosiphila megalodicopiae]|uniref:hypothetical protein n=1 Tax=Marinicellulosiphila megalodicopiae TaxID=2724896 RepID=UPI003BB03DF1
MNTSAKQLWEEVSKQAGLQDTQKMSQDELDQQSNRNLKQKYARWFIYILIAQLIMMNFLIVLQGVNVISLDEVSFRFYTTSTIIEVFGVIVIIVKNLFPSK